MIYYKVYKWNKFCFFFRRITVLILLFILFFTYVGMEVAFGTFIYTMVTSTIYSPMDKTQGTLLNTVFWAALAVGRGLAIPISVKFSPKSLQKIIKVSFDVCSWSFVFLKFVFFLSSVLINVFCSKSY